MRALPLGPVAAVTALVATLGVSHTLYQRHEAKAQQGALLRERDALQDEVRAPMANLVDKVEAFTVQLAGDGFSEQPATELPPADSVYVHLRLADARSKSTVHAAAQLGVVDGLAGCLHPGEEVFAYGDLVAQSELLGDRFTKSVEASWDKLSLDAHAGTLARHRDGHHASLRAALGKAKLVVIALDEESGFVRVGVRRLEDGATLVRTRLAPSFTLVTVAGGPPSPLAKKQAEGCSVANLLLAAR